MKNQSPHLALARSLSLFIAIVASSIASLAAGVTAGAEIAQWPIPGRDIPSQKSMLPESQARRAQIGIGFREQKGMLPEMVDHHAETVAKVLKAIAYNDHAAFVFRATTHFQKAAPKAFELLTAKWGKRLRDGFRVTPIGELRRKYATSLWRVQFELEGQDEAIAVLATDKRGNITTFDLL